MEAGDNALEWVVQDSQKRYWRVKASISGETEHVSSWFCEIWTGYVLEKDRAWWGYVDHPVGQKITPEKVMQAFMAEVMDATIKFARLEK